MPWNALPLLCLLTLLSPAVSGAQPMPRPPGAPPAQLCRAAIAQAEREAGLPDRLLAAIGRVESGRRDAGTGETAPWPWTINAEGRGSFFPDRTAAIAAVRALQAEGVRSIDVGCMQINLRHHPGAFASLEEAFEPLANARYAARFLTELQATRGDWMRSAAHYHSQTPEHAETYRAKVAAAWAAEREGPAAPGYAAALRAHGSFGGAGAPMLEAPGARAAALLPPAGGGGAGRGLDAYRARPIVMIGRVAAPLPALAVAGPPVPGMGPALGRPAAIPVAAPGLPTLAAPTLALPAPGRPAAMPTTPAGAAFFRSPAPAAPAAAGPLQGGATFSRPAAAGPLVPLLPRGGGLPTAPPPRRS